MSGPARPRYQELLVIIAYVAAVLLIAALLAPVFFAGGQSLLTYANAHQWQGTALWGGLHSFLEKTSFPSYFDRTALLAALAGLYPLMKYLRISGVEMVGSVPWNRGLYQVIAAFSLAVGLLAILSGICVWTGVCRIKPDAGWLRIGAPLASGFTVACLEEFLFRGAMLTTLRRSLGPGGAAFWTTFLFSILHFLKPPDHDALPAASVTWASGFWIIPQLFRGFADWKYVIAEFLLLAGVGWGLARARLSSHGLWAGIGLHAGWVAGMKHFSQLATPSKAFYRGDFFPWFVENHCKSIVSPFVGLVPVAIVVLTGALLLILIRLSGWNVESVQPSFPQTHSQ